MCIQVVWDDDKQTILRFDGRDSWTWTQFDNAVDEAVACIRSVNHSVDIIGLLPPRFPPGLPLLHLQRSLVLWPPNIDKLVLVGSSPFQKYLNNLLIVVFPSFKDHLVFADTLEEAYQVIAE